MLNLIRFFFRNGPFFVWQILTIVSFILLVQHNPYQRSVWMGSANYISGSFYKASDNVSSYFGLRQINSEQLSHIAELENEVLRLKHLVRNYEDFQS